MKTFSKKFKHGEAEKSQFRNSLPIKLMRFALTKSAFKSVRVNSFTFSRQTFEGFLVDVFAVENKGAIMTL